MIPGLSRRSHIRVIKAKGPTQREVDSFVYQIAACVSKLNEARPELLATHYPGLLEIQLGLNGIFNAAWKAHLLAHPAPEGESPVDGDIRVAAEIAASKRAAE